MTDMKTAMLEDKTEVLIRPLTHDDLEGALAFFRSLPEEEFTSLPRDASYNVCQERIQDMEEGRVKRLVALMDGKIVAEGSLEPASYGRNRRIGELKLIVAPGYQHKNLSVLMARALYELAKRAGFELLTYSSKPRVSESVRKEYQGIIRAAAANL